MTSATANSFVFTTLSTNNGASGVRRKPDNLTQLSRLQRIGNLTDWKSIHADIQLQPSSCVESYLDLVVRQNPITLLPIDHTPNNATITALATAHNTQQLQRRCRKIEEELSQQTKTRHKLYLAAGFVVYQSNGETKRAPILLIPVTLERMRGRASNYTIKYLSGMPLRVNPHVADMCNTHIEQRVKAFQDTTELREYLRNIESKVHKDFRCTISANTGIISLQANVLTDLGKAALIDIELERTKPGTVFKPLPATPDRFEPQLAIKVLRFTETENLHSALHSLAGQSESDNAPVDDVDPDLDGETLGKYHDCAGWLIDVGLGHWKLKDIAKLPGRMLAMESSINQLLANHEFTDNFRDEYRTVGMLHRLNKVKDKICHAPPEMKYHSISLHADSKTRLLLQQAKIQASSLEHEMQYIRDTFRQGAVPSSKALNRLIDIIARRNDESQLTNPEYFRARSTLNDILGYHNGILTDNDLEQLRKLARTLQFSDTFNNDPVYKRHFGSLFKGTDTNWQRLDSVVSFHNTLSQELGSSLLVAQFADRWVSFERDFSSMVSRIESAACSAYKLCSLIPMFVDQSTRLEHASRTAEKFRCRINQWQKFLHRNLADTELTPLQLLSHFDLGDHSSPSVTLSPQELDERIYRHIVDNDLSFESVSATSRWLQNVLVNLKTDTATVRRFLDREATLQSKLR